MNDMPCRITDGIQYDTWLQENSISADEECNMTDVKDYVEIRWYVCDVLDVRPDLTHSQALEVLHDVQRYHSAEIGVNWEVLEEAANDLFPALITPITPCHTYKTGSLRGITRAGIIEVLGFAENVEDDESKVTYSWGFEYKGKPYAIWDWKGSYRQQHWSVFGDPDGLRELFGLAYEEV